ncbi:unnamed protein product [Sympodiomycopsis kandeliae]
MASPTISSSRSLRQPDGGSHNDQQNEVSQPRSHDFARSPSSSSQLKASQQRKSPSRRVSGTPNENGKPSRPALGERTLSASSELSFAGDAAETYHEARQAFSRGKASPYFMAVVALLCSLSQGLPLASMFKVYTFLICEAYESSGKLGDQSSSSSNNTTGTLSTAMLRVMQSAARPFGASSIPPAPELPHPPQCNDPEVQRSTSAYAAAMATTGALLALLALDRVTKISRHFGRKPIMLLPQILIALAFVGFRASVAVNQFAGVILLFTAVVLLEASANAPLRIAIQNYIVDTTTDSQRAGALSFIEGFGQLGAFPSSTLGGFIAAMTGEFFAPFYSSICVAVLTFFFILILVPESKKHRHHTLIDQWEHSAEAEERQENANRRLRSSEAGRRESYRSDAPSYVSTESAISTSGGGWRHWVKKINFLHSLSIFLPTRYGRNAGKRAGSLDFRLLNLAAIVIFEETFQVFLVPTLLLFNGDIFDFDVLQNGYIVSLLQGVRALFLTAIFPPVVAFARRSISAHVQKRKDQKKAAKRQQQRAQPVHRQQPQQQDQSRHQSNEQTPLLRPLATVRQMRRTSSHFGLGHEDGEADSSRWSRSDFTSTTIAKQEERGKLDIVIMVASYALATGSFILLALSRRFMHKLSPWIFLSLGVIGTQLSSGGTSIRTSLIVNAVSEDDQSTALAANQVLCTVVYATVPVATSLIYGFGLEKGIPELVWIFKALFAFLAAVSALGLFITHRGKSAGSEESSDDSDDSDDGGGDEGNDQGR